MRFDVVAAVFLLVDADYVHGSGEVRVDDNKRYFSNQRIVDAFNKSQPLWVYGHNFDKSKDVDKIEKIPANPNEPCTFYKNDHLNSSHVNFSRHHYLSNGTKTSTPLFGTFFTTDARGLNSEFITRKEPNGVNVSDSPGGETQKSYKLVFTNYKDCSIIRPFTHGSPEAEHYGASYRGTSGVCILLLGDSAARRMIKKGEEKEEKKQEEDEEGDNMKFFRNVGKALPEGLSAKLPLDCRLIYPHACGSNPFTVVFDKSCPHIPNALGC